VTTPLSLLLLAGGAGGASVSPSVTSSLYLRQCTAEDTLCTTGLGGRHGLIHLPALHKGTIPGFGFERWLLRAAKLHCRVSVSEPAVHSAQMWQESCKAEDPACHGTSASRACRVLTRVDAATHQPTTVL